MIKPKALIISGYGLNCEEETQLAFELSGAKADIVHINDLISKDKKLSGYQILAFPGGFAYGDDTGAGNAFANRLRNNLWEEVLQFVEKGKLVIGLCNGFQIMVNLGLFPATQNNYGSREVALLSNASARYTVRWVDLQVKSSSPWFVNMTTVSVPIAHGEGRFYATKEVLQKLKTKHMIAATYYSGEICTALSLDANPNGSTENIAAITDSTGRIMGMMPHPERALFFTQLPHWTYLKETTYRNKQLPKYGPGLKIYQNGVNYFV